MRTDLQVWKVPIRSRQDGFTDSKVDEARQFCFEKEWVGIGWGLDGIPDLCPQTQAYELVFYSLDSKSSLPFENPKAALRAHHAIAMKMKIGDFVWCRTKKNIYWLGKVSGNWEYRSSGDFARFDLHQVRTCNWRRVGSSDEVPGPVKNNFAGRGPAICRINSGGQNTIEDTMRIWADVNGDGTTPNSARSRYLSEFGHDDLEDLVALYLQVEREWHVVITTAKHSTPGTECVFRNAANQRAHLQVKSGEERCDYSIQVPQEVDQFFMFDLGKKDQDELPSKIVKIDPGVVAAFANGHPQWLPKYLRGAHFEVGQAGL